MMAWTMAVTGGPPDGTAQCLCEPKALARAHEAVRMQSDGTLDRGGLMCPMPIVQPSKGMKAMPQGKVSVSNIKKTGP